MGKHAVFTFSKKYSFIGVIFLLVLTGCATNEPIDANSSGWFAHNLVYPFSLFIKFVASLFRDNFGLSIIAITVLIRLALMPFMLKQMKKSRQMQEKMKVVKPEMDALKEKYKDKKDANAQRQMQQEMAQIYQKHQINPISSMGCLPMIIQLPIVLGFYYAIRRTPEIAAHNFLWFNLGHTDIVLTLLAVIVYFAQSRVTLIGMEPSQKKKMAVFGLISPIMIGIISLNVPAALPLYWTVSGLLLAIQTYISKKTIQTK